MSIDVVYAVVSGEYSDYSVERIFELRSDAEAYIAATGGGSEVEEFDFHAAGSPPTLYRVYSAAVYPREGLEIRQTSWMATEQPVHTPVEHHSAAWSHIGASGPDRERVLKSVSDRLARWKAQQAGIA